MLLILTSCAMLLSYVSVYINPSLFALPMFFGLFFIPIAFINLSLLTVALVKGSRSAWIPLITLLPALLFAESFFKIGNGERQNETEKGLKIESYNVGMFASFDPVALDKACADLVIQAPILHNDNVLSHNHGHDDLCGCDKFHLMHPDTDWLAGLRHAEEIGLGTLDYELIKL